ncbi:MAG: class I SAM-dependent methyltransferase [Actinomycetota bacterium]
MNVVDFARDLIDWRGDERVLDIGSGPGRYLEGFRAIHPRLRTVACDLSEGMARAAREHSDACVGSIASIPFEARSFDVTLAMHMLYHAEDIPAAIEELKRVTTVGGTVLVSTNSTTHLRELKGLFAEALAHGLRKPVSMPAWPDERFSLENGQELLEQTFSNVKRKAAWGTLRVPSSEPIVSYIRSLKLFELPDDRPWEQVLAYVRERSDEIIRAKGSFEIAARAGVFVCR